MSLKVGDRVQVSDEPYLYPDGGGFVYHGFAGQVGVVTWVDSEGEAADVEVADLPGYPFGLSQFVNQGCLTLVEEGDDG